MTPLRKQSFIKKAWRVGYPIGIHFLISQIVAGICIWYLTRRLGLSEEAYLNQAVFMTGIIALLSMVPSVYFYHRDYVCRTVGGVISAKKRSRLTGMEGLLLLITGAGLAQYGNVLIGLLQTFLNYTEYQESMERMTEGKSFLMLVFWMGIAAPIAEEFIFRWLIYLRLRDYMRMAAAAVLSGLLFGIYHGNLIQAVYASILGAAFAYVLEMSGNLWSCVLLHIGANVWSLILSEFGMRLLEENYGIQILLGAYLILFVTMIFGLSYFVKKWKGHKRRII